MYKIGTTQDIPETIQSLLGEISNKKPVPVLILTRKENRSGREEEDIPPSVATTTYVFTEAKILECYEEIDISEVKHTSVHVYNNNKITDYIISHDNVKLFHNDNLLCDIYSYETDMFEVTKTVCKYWN